MSTSREYGPLAHYLACWHGLCGAVAPLMGRNQGHRCAHARNITSERVTWLPRSGALRVELGDALTRSEQQPWGGVGLARRLLEPDRERLTAA